MKMKKKIIVFRNQLFKKSEIFITQQSEAISEFDVVYMGRRCLGDPPEGAQVITINNGNSLPSKFNEVMNSITMNPRVYEKHLLDMSNVELIHSHFAIDAMCALPLARNKSIPLVTTLHGFDVTTNKKAFLLSKSPSWINYYFFNKKLMSSGDKFICVSDFIANTAISKGFDENKIIKHYIGIDVDRIQVRDKSEEQQVILHVARLVEKKGTAILISALKRIIDKIGDYKLVIIGDGPLNVDLKKQVISLGLEKNVLFLGAQDHNTVMQWMRKATMFILPSITASTGDAEGLGMVLLEAGATGIPIIGTNHGGIPEVIRDGYNGFLIEERDVDSLAERILFLIENSTTRYDMGINARNYVSRYFNIEVQTKKLEQVYKELING